MKRFRAGPRIEGSCYHLLELVSHMRTFGLGLLVLAAVLAAIVFAPRDRPRVVWEDDSPYCPWCRSEVNEFASVCAECGREFTWSPLEVECRSCLSDRDAARLAALYRKSPDLYRQRLTRLAVDSGMPESLIEGAMADLVLWAESIHGGACLFCGGTGRWLAPELAGGVPVEDRDDPLLRLAMQRLGGDCPACLGTGRCLACGGDHVLLAEEEAARRALGRLQDALDRIDPGTDEESAREFFSLVRDFLERHSGRAEIEDAPALYAVGEDEMGWGLGRLELVSGALREED